MRPPIPVSEEHLHPEFGYWDQDWVHLARLTEVEWAECEQCDVLLRTFLLCHDDRLTDGMDRKLRLFACACCRVAEPLWGLPAAGEFLNAAELHIDRLTRPRRLRRLRQALHTDLVGVRPHRAPEQLVLDVVESPIPIDTAIAAPLQVIYFSSHLAGAAESDTRRRLCHLFRDIVGNPYHVVHFEEHWRTWNDRAVVRLAEAIHAGRTFADLPVLADALEEAGCADAAVLDHCRQPGEHARGCWVVDSVLGKG